MTTFQSPKRHTLRHLAGAALLCALATTAAAQAWPTKAVSLVVPFPAGGTTDVLARALGQELAKSLGQPVIVENKPGAGATLGADFVAKAKPDGYTLLMGAVHHTIATSVYRKLAYDFQKDLAPVTTVAMVPNVLVVQADSSSRTVPELIAQAKRAPGKFTFGSNGNGTGQHLIGAQFEAIAGVQLLHVPYKGSGPMTTDLLGGQISMSFDTITPVLPHIKGGKLRALAVTSRARNPALPDVPTVIESGLKGFEVVGFYGFLAPAGTPKDVVAKLSDAFGQVMQSPEVKSRMVSQGADPAFLGADDFAKFLASEMPRWADAVKKSGAKLD